MIVCNGWIKHGYNVDIMGKNNVNKLKFSMEKTTLSFLYDLLIHNNIN